MPFFSSASQFFHRTIALALMSAVLPINAAAQERARTEIALTVGERVNVELRSGSQVIGTVVVRSRNQVQIEGPGGKTRTIRYVDVREIRDVDTGATVAVPAPFVRDTRWVRPVVIAAVVAVGLGTFLRAE